MADLVFLLTRNAAGLWNEYRQHFEPPKAGRQIADLVLKLLSEIRIELGTSCFWIERLLLSISNYLCP